MLATNLLIFFGYAVHFYTINNTQLSKALKEQSRCGAQGDCVRVFLDPRWFIYAGWLRANRNDQQIVRFASKAEKIQLLGSAHQRMKDAQVGDDCFWFICSIEY